MFDDTEADDTEMTLEEIADGEQQEVKKLTKEERQKALADGIAMSKQLTIPKSRLTEDGLSVIHKNASGEITGYSDPGLRYEFDTRVDHHRLLEDDITEFGDYFSKVAKSTVLLCPEYQAGIVDQRDYFNPDGFFGNGTSLFIRGDNEVRFSSSDRATGFHLTVHNGPVTEKASVQDAGNRIEYERTEDMDDSIAFMRETNTEEAVAGIEQLLEWVRTSGELNRDLPDEVFKSTDAVWKRIVNMADPIYFAKSIFAIGGSITWLADHPSLETAIGAGAASAFVGVETWRKAKSHEKSQRARAQEIINAGELVWGHPPR